MMIVVFNVQISIWEQNTLTDSSTKIKRGNKGDVSVLKPTAMTSVPVSIWFSEHFSFFQCWHLLFKIQLILDRISKEISNKIQNGSSFQKGLFQFAYEYKKKWTRRGYLTPILDMYDHFTGCKQRKLNWFCELTLAFLFQKWQVDFQKSEPNNGWTYTNDVDGRCATITRNTRIYENVFVCRCYTRLCIDRNHFRWNRCWS